MVKYTNSLIIPCESSKFLHYLMYLFYDYMKSNEGKKYIDSYEILSVEWASSNILKRKSRIIKKNIFQFIPQGILLMLPKNITDNCFNHIEETEINLNNNIITWNVYADCAQKLFNLHGNTVIQSINNNTSSLITVSLIFEFDKKIDIKNLTLLYILNNIIAKQIPLIIFKNIKMIYQSLYTFIINNESTSTL